MAIEFNCPHCSAMIRVPDNAGGGKGKCPRCARRITVPKVSTKAPPKTASADSDLFAAPDADEFGTPEADDPNGVTFAAADSDGSAGPPDVFVPGPRALGELPFERPRQALRPGSIASRLKRKNSRGTWLIPVGFGVLLCGALGWFLWQQYQTERLVGELTAETAAFLELPPVELSSSSFKQSPAEMKTIIAELEKTPVRSPGSLMQIQVGANKRAVTIRLNAGPKTSFYRVETKNDHALLNYRKVHTIELERLREEDLEQAASKYVDEYQRVLDKKSERSALNDLRNPLALSAMTKGLGYQLVAAYGQNEFVCVYEDQDGAVYFLLPPGAQAFEIKGRKNKDGKVVFPGTYHVKVAGEIKEPSHEKGDAADKKKPKKESTNDEKMDMKESLEDGEMKKNMGESKPRKTDQ